MKKISFVIFLFFLFQSTLCIASEDNKTPGISDREIIQRSLTELKAGKKENRKLIEQLREDMDNRFDQMYDFVNARFEDVNRGFEDKNARFQDMNVRFQDMNARFEDMNARFGDMNQHFEFLHNLTMGGFAITFTGIFSLIGFLIWDRKKSNRELEKRIEIKTKELIDNLFNKFEEHSQIQRLLNENAAMRSILYNFSKKNLDMAEIIDKNPYFMLN